MIVNKCNWLSIHVIEVLLRVKENTFHAIKHIEHANDCPLMLMNEYSNIAIESRSVLMKLIVALMKVHNMLLIQLWTQINAHFLLMNSKRCKHRIVSEFRVARSTLAMSPGMRAAFNELFPDTLHARRSSLELRGWTFPFNGWNDTFLVTQNTNGWSTNTYPEKFF